MKLVSSGLAFLINAQFLFIKQMDTDDKFAKLSASIYGFTE